MPDSTTNYNLKKPLNTEYYDVDIQNDNMDLIDAALAPIADPSQVPSGLTGKIGQWVSWITNRIKAITGKTNWYDAPDITLAQALSHISSLNAHCLLSDVTIYVSPTGNDTTGNGTSGNPYATITKALSMIPKNLNGYTPTISIAAGTYNEVVTISGYVGGYIYLILTGSIIVNGIIVSNGSCIRVSGAYTINTNYIHCYKKSSWMSLASVIIALTGAGATPPVEAASVNLHCGSQSHMYASGVITINNSTAVYAVSITAGSIVTLGNLSGTNNTGTSLYMTASSMLSYGANTLSAAYGNSIHNSFVLTNDSAFGSNKNLLINPDWRNPVNQRNKSGTMSTAGYFIDQVKLEQGSVAIVANTGIKLIGSATAAVVNMYLEKLLDTSKVYTLSAEINGVIYSASFNPDSTNTWHNFTTNIRCRMFNNGTPAVVSFVNDATTIDYTISRVKLELGSVSTLANDPPVDFGEEFTKCLRYFWRPALGYGINYMPGYNPYQNNGVKFNLYFPTTMRANPTITINQIRNESSGELLTVSSSNAIGGPSTLYVINNIVTSQTLYTNVVYAFDLSFSAEL
ncbi:MAG: hypothetical protein N2Z65_03260 [Clostridiales bacterium]|nr:hypothetical protein [Clostridiales bacterium]